MELLAARTPGVLSRAFQSLATMACWGMRCAIWQLTGFATESLTPSCYSCSNVSRYLLIPHARHVSLFLQIS